MTRITGTGLANQDELRTAKNALHVAKAVLYCTLTYAWQWQRPTSTYIVRLPDTTTTKKNMISTRFQHFKDTTVEDPEGLPWGPWTPLLKFAFRRFVSVSFSFSHRCCYNEMQTLA